VWSLFHYILALYYRFTHSGKPLVIPAVCPPAYVVLPAPSASIVAYTSCRSIVSGSGPTVVSLRSTISRAKRAQRVRELPQYRRTETHRKRGQLATDRGNRAPDGGRAAGPLHIWIRQPGRQTSAGNPPGVGWSESCAARAPALPPPCALPLPDAVGGIVPSPHIPQPNPPGNRSGRL
jgi:hypothetical protein